MNERLFKYRGTVSVMTVEPANNNMVDLILGDVSDLDKSPMRITAYGALAKYIYQIEGTDAEERYIASDWCYDRNLTLHRIEVPSKDPDEVAKIITSPSTISNTLVIFGPQEYIETPCPPAMSADQYIAWYQFLNGSISPWSEQAPAEDEEMDL